MPTDHGTITISRLKGMRFYVPAYQRGYRWTEHEVKALLDDVYEFKTEDGKKSYCIQPLIVEKRTDGRYEVVDGQQRLTTIYIFLKIIRARNPDINIPFDLEYEKYENQEENPGASAGILANLEPEGEVDKNSIDNFHITTARNTINEWLRSRPDRFEVVSEMYKKLRNSVYFVWYELPPGSDAIFTFTKVNMGKIPLTSAELIKALLLKKDNFKKDDDEIRKQQLKVSLEWDRIEQGLQDDSFWYFLKEKEQSGTRIDLLFDLLAEIYNEKQPENERIPYAQNNFSFYVLLSAMRKAKNKERLSEKIWNKVQELYLTFRDWYDDLEKYHIIGYLLHTKGGKISDIVRLTSGKRKSEINNILRERAKDTIPGGWDKSTLSALECNQTDSQTKKIRKLLLLFNVATLVCKSEKEYRFPFDIYKKQSWDIEHIHASADASAEPDDALGNLTLLDSSTNRNPNYAAESFDVKRAYILERESSGQFVPLCTKNVFLKVYTENPKNLNLWGSGNEDDEDNDKEYYIEALTDTLNAFFAGETKK